MKDLSLPEISAFSSKNIPGWLTGFILQILASVFFMVFCQSCTISRNTFITVQQLPLYGSGGISDTRYEDIPPSESFEIFGSKIEDQSQIIYKSSKVWTTGISKGTRLHSTVRVKRSVYKKYLTTLKNPYYAGLPMYRGTRSLSPSSPRSRSSYSGSSGSIPHTPRNGATIYTGPRGGRYYINSNGNKTYIKK